MRSYVILLLLLDLFALFGTEAAAKTVHYKLSVTQQDVNLSGKKTVDFSLAVNGQIPAPTLEFTEGDDAEIEVKNNLTEELSIHWHGILLPPEMDGVSYTNTPPILSGQKFTFRFKIRQHGTYWYHSHTMLQEQKGVYGALIIHPKQKTFEYNRDVVAVLSDWTDENPDQVLKNLRKDGDYYLYKKNSIRSIFGAIEAGSFKSYVGNEWIRMGGMDLSDVGYDTFLINGKRNSQLLNTSPGERIRLRIINAAASSYFYVSFGQSPMKVISADGVDIQPIMAKELLMGMAETYDILVTLPENKNYELRATAQDITGYASAWIGMGEKVSAPTKQIPNPYASMDHSSHQGHIQHAHSSSEHQEHMLPGDISEHNYGNSAHSSHNEHARHHNHHEESPDTTAQKPLQLIESLGVDNLKSLAPTMFSGTRKIHKLKLVLGGDMERYIWHINGKAIHEDRTITIDEGNIIEFEFVNETMMHHPMHLHGHFFRVLNKYGDLSPLKHTVDVAPHGSRTIQFYANERGQWMLHCHNLYHMKTGMARIVKYSSYTPSSEIAEMEKRDHHLHDHPYFYGSASAFSNRLEGYFRVDKTWDRLEARIESASDSKHHFSTNGEWDFEADVFYRRWNSQFLNLIAGGTYFDKNGSGVVGVGYVLPLLIETKILLSHRGKLRLDLEKKLQWTRNFLSDLEIKWRPGYNEHSFEVDASLMYAPTWSWSIGIASHNGVIGFGLKTQF